MSNVALIPIQPIPNQVVTVLINNQKLKIELRQKSTGLYCSLFLDDVLKLRNIICHDRVAFPEDSYHGLNCTLQFVDTQGLDDPEYSLLGSRFLLAALTND